jgi:hypothetical protein
MGQQTSQQRSTFEDITSNLHSALVQQAVWEERAWADKDVLIARELASELGEGRIDTGIETGKPSGPHEKIDKGDVRKDAEREKFHEEKPQGKEEPKATVSEPVRAPKTAESEKLSGEHAPQVKDEAEEQRHRLERIKLEEPKPENKAAIAGTPEQTRLETRQVVLDVEKESMLKERKILIGKFVFIYKLLQKLVKNGEENFKLRSKIHFLNDQLKNQKPVAKIQCEQRIEKLTETLTNSLGRYDNATTAINWLKRDYELGFQMMRFNDELRMAKAQFERAKTEEIERAKSGEFEKRLKELKTEKEKLMDAKIEHEREALSVGLAYLDANLSGYLEPEDVPDMTAELFTKLDANRDNRISRQELQEFISRSSQDIFSLTNKAEELASERQRLVSQIESSHGDKRAELEAELVRKDNEFQALEKQLQSVKQVSQDVYTIFHRAFTEHVFKKLGGEELTHTEGDFSQMEQIAMLNPEKFFETVRPDLTARG